MGETNEEPMLFSQIEYFRLMSQMAETIRDTRAINDILHENFAMRQYVTEEKKPFKFLTNN